MKKKKHRKHLIDPLIAFFEDVAQIPIISGREDYLPLTRRIHCRVVLDTLNGDSSYEKFYSLMQEVEQSLIEVEKVILEGNFIPLDLAQLLSEVDSFLDQPQRALPNTLSEYKLAGDSFEQLTRKLVFLFILLPPPVRSEYPNITFSSEIEVYFEAIRTEAQKSQIRLVEGTLRYVVNFTNSEKFLASGLDYLDLVQEGFLGLWRAASGGYDENTGHFQSYATTWVWQRVSRAIIDLGNLVRLPVHMSETIFKLERSHIKFYETHGYPPNIYELFALAGWQINLENNDIDQTVESDESDLGEFTSISVKRATELFNYYIRNITFYHLHEPNPIKFYYLLVDEDTSQITDTNLMNRYIQDILRILPDREQEIIGLRYGIKTGEEYTLEQIGQISGVTRERIRQIEDRVIKRLQSSSVKSFAEDYLGFDPEVAKNISIEEKQKAKLSQALYEDYYHHPYDNPEEIMQKVESIQNLIDKYIERARPRDQYIGEGTGRRKLFLNLLREVGKPIHYTELHRLLLERLPETDHFEKGKAYTVLFYSPSFRSYGNGIFGLSEWEDQPLEIGFVKVLTHCPEPLLPVQSFTTSFFESIMVGRELMNGQQLTIKQFWQEMLNWSGHESISSSQIQLAFDAWYAAGFCNRIRYEADGDQLMQTTIPLQANLTEIRLYCLNSLLERVDKMPELLWSLNYISHPTINNIKQVLYGNSDLGVDLSTRLNLLAAFDAVQNLQGDWRLTAIGRSLLPTKAPDELIDLLTNPSEQNQKQFMDDDLGFLDF